MKGQTLKKQKLKKVKQAFKELNKEVKGIGIGKDIICKYCNKKTKKIINGSGIVRCSICGNKV